MRPTVRPNLRPTLRSVRPFRALSLVALSAVVALGAAACGGSSGGSSGNGSGSSGSASKGSVAVGSAGFTESEIMASMYADLLGKAGYKTKVNNVSSTEIFQSSLESGQIDVVPEYVATYADFLNTAINGQSATAVSSPDLQKTLDALKPLAAQKGLSVLQPTQAVDQNAFAVSKAFADQHHLTTLSDLGNAKLPVTIAAGAECATRPFCQPGLEKTYGIKVDGIDKLGVDTIESKKAVQTGKDEMALVLTTDATVADFGLVVLQDDKHLQNADYLVPIVNTKTLNQHQDIADVLNKLVGVLTTDDLAQMNKKVDIERQKPADVAEAYLKDKGLI
ncbi:MAG: ABC transporter substrate-binding protein [Frankiaceae bacterium]